MDEIQNDLNLVYNILPDVPDENEGIDLNHTERPLDFDTYIGYFDDAIEYFEDRMDDCNYTSESVKKLLKEQEDLISRKEEDSDRAKEIKVELLEARKAAITEGIKKDTILRNNKGGCLLALEFHESYAINNPKNVLKNIIESYSSGTLSNEELIVSLNNLLGMFSGNMKISYYIGEIVSSQLENDAYIEKVENQLKDPTKSEQELSILRNDLYTYKTVQKSLNLHKTCLLNGVEERLNDTLITIKQRVIHSDDVTKLK
ncbi:MAG: hypothetical protein RSD96_01260 [Bacilli bacterium]